MTTRPDPQWQMLLKALPTYRRCIVTSHVDGEGDSFGSQLALAHLLRQLQKQVWVICDSRIPDNLQFLPGIDAIRTPGNRLPAYDALFVVDVPVLERLGKVATLHDPSKPIILLDHHPSHTPFGSIRCIDVEAASAGEMVYRLYDALKIPIDQEAAVSMYVSMMTDTGSFRYANTRANTHEIAARLIRAGVQPAWVYQQVYEHRTVAELRLEALALHRLRVSADGTFAWITVSQAMLRKTQTPLNSSEALVDLPRSLWGTEAVFVARQVERLTWRVSLRSKGRMDVSAVAQQFSGGGHRAASGCTIKGTEADIVEQLHRALRTAYRQQVKPR